MALGSGRIDAASFATARVVSGAVLLQALLLTLSRGRRRSGGGSWPAAAMLFTYMIAFSFAYLSLSAGTGALILFGAVQTTMLLQALRAGERPHPLTWAGLVLALGGLVYLVLPGLQAPPLAGSLLMAAAGVAWGIYSLLGRRSTLPLADTAHNFLRAVPLVLAVSALTAGSLRLTGPGLLLAVLSGALASGLGYALWYAALAGLTATRAAVVQLSVPILAAGGGVLLLGEAISRRLLLAMVLILGGVGLALAAREAPPAARGRG